MNRKFKICLVGSSGGHLIQMINLKSATINEKIYLFVSFIIIISGILNFLFFRYLSYFEVLSIVFLFIFLLYMTNILFEEVIKFNKIYEFESSKNILHLSFIIAMTVFAIISPTIYLIFIILELI